MARDDSHPVGKGHEALVDRVDELAPIAAGEVGTAYRAVKEGVASDEERLIREVEADAAFGVTWGMEDGASDAVSIEAGVGADRDEFAIVESIVRRRHVGGADAKPGGLNIHHADEGEIVLVVEDRCAGELLEFCGAGDVVNVGMSDEDVFDGEGVLPQQSHDSRDLVAGVYDDGFAGDLVAEDGAVALEGADGEDFVNHVWAM